MTLIKNNFTIFTWSYICFKFRYKFETRDFTVFFLWKSCTYNQSSCVASNSVISFSFHNIMDSDTIMAINSIKSNSEGLDDIPIAFIKLLLPLISPIITHICNSILTKPVFPKYWKVFKVITRQKNTRYHILDDYRAIRLLPSLSIALEEIMKLRMTN